MDNQLYCWIDKTLYNVDLFFYSRFIQYSYNLSLKLQVVYLDKYDLFFSLFYLVYFKIEAFMCFTYKFIKLKILTDFLFL